MTDKAVESPLFDRVVAAASRISQYCGSTPLVQSPMLSRHFGADVWLKNETLSPIASFKLRGAFNAMLRARETSALKRAVTSSTGNHGQGVAYAARALNVPSDIFLADNPNPMKRSMIELLGANTHIGGDVIEAKRRAKSFCATVGGMFVDDGESVDVIEGAGTVGLEIANALPHVDLVLAPMGSGSLASGVAAAMKGAQPQARVIAVQPEDSPAVTHSFHAREAVYRPGTSIADCLACRMPAPTALGALLRFVDDAILVSDPTLLSAVHTLLVDAHMLAEPGAAAGLAGAYQLRDKLRGQRVVVVVTGANITMEHLRRVLDSPPLFAEQRSLA